MENLKPDAGIILSNAILHITKRINCYDIVKEENTEILHIQINFTDMDKTAEYDIPYSDITCSKSFDFFERAGVIFSNEEKKAFKNNILQQRRLSSENALLKLPQGHSEYQGTHYWVLGNMVYSNNSNCTPAITDKNAPTIRKSTDGSYLQALHFLEVDDAVTPMLFLAIGFSVWDNLLEKAGYPQRAAIYITGKSGSGKSSLAREITKIFEEKSEMTLSSTYAALQTQIQKYCAVPILLDDFNKSDYGKIMKDKGIKVAELIQAYADRENLCKTENRSVVQLNINGGLIITAEQPLENPSTMNRCLVVTPKELDWSALTEIQNANCDNAIFTDLLKQLIHYTLTNYNWIINKIPEWHHKICEEGKGYDAYSDFSGYRRIMGSYRVFMLVIKLWKGFFDENNISSSPIVKKMKKALEASIEYTFSFLDADDPNIYLLHAIRKGLSNAIDKKKITYSKKDFEKGRYAGLYTNDKCIYIRGDTLQEFVSNEVGEEVSKKRISNALYSHRLIKQYKGRFSRPIPNSNTNLRYYDIDFKRLLEVCNSDDDTLSIFM